MNDAGSCLLTLSEAVAWRESLRKDNRRLVITNGCFDILHRGHASYLAQARELGDALLVLINTDRSVRELKGDKRPVVCEEDRAFLLNSLKSVDRVVLFDDKRCTRELAALAPDIYVKAGDYTLETLAQDERQALESCGSKIVFMSFVANRSTTGVIEKILEAYK